MAKRKDINGQVFGRLTVLEYVGLNKHKQALWKCQCECGNIVTVIGKYLRNGHTKSCGCLQKERTIEASTKHGHNRYTTTGVTSTYRSWQDMKKRCLNSNNNNYQNYGGRGITYDPKWEDFNNFLADMGEKPSDGKTYTIERIDVNGNYEPDNCYWLERPLQGRNRRDTVLTEEVVKEARQRHANGERLCDLAEEYGVNKCTLSDALKYRTWKDIA